MQNSQTAANTAIARGKSRRGFTLLEMVLVLLVAGTLFGSLFQLLSNSHAQIEAQTAAQQQQNMIRAVRTYVINNFNSITANTSVSPSALTPQQPTTNVYGQTFTIVVHPISTTEISFLISTSGGTALKDSLGGLVASMVGSDGGFVYNNEPAGCANSWVPAFNSVSCIQTSALNATYGITPAPGYIASVTYVTSSDLNNDLSQYLDRLPSTPINNTMQAEEQFATTGLNSPDGNASPVSNPGIAMGGHNIYMYGSTTAGAPGSAGNIIMEGGSIALGTPSPAITGAPATGGSGGGTLYTYGGNVDLTNNGQIILGSGTSPNCFISGGGGTSYDTCDLRLNGITSTLYAINGTFSGTLSAAEFDYQSDRRLKKEITPLPGDMLEKLMALQPVSFRWKNNDKKEIGLIAQDVAAQFPDLVNTDPKTGYLSVQMGNLVSPIIAALQELQEENQQLKSAISAQQKEIDRLQHQQQSISSQ